MITKIKYIWRNRPFTKIWNEYHNPFYHWFKVRKYFKRPKMHLVKGEYNGYFGLPCRLDSYHKGLNFFIRSLGWKDKFNSPRHEYDPIICFIWVNPWKTWVPNKFSKETNSKGESGFYLNKQYLFGWTFNWITSKDYRDDSYTSSMATWESILDILYYNRTIEWCKSNHKWLSGVGKDAKEITIDKNLK